ncbi:carboxylating nicotinate-nucleotide diphosphorylase, partial [bacterium]|nr:carboxylating nicotinate-nucleotide diphosphorylase [bacterium]
MRWYDQVDSLPDSYVVNKLQDYFFEDMPNGDIGTEAVFSRSEGDIRANFTARQDLIFCGVPVIKNAFSSQHLNIFYKDGQKIEKGSIIAQISGKSVDILPLERTVLNLLQHLSGIATLTDKYVQAVKDRIAILDTRKTTPGLRLFEKYAVSCGGGRNHRLDLSSGIILKDNHIAAAQSVTLAVQRCKTNYSDLIMELEVDKIEQLPELLDAGVDAILLDNMDAKTAEQAVQIINKYSRGNRVFIEASGGITLRNVRSYMNT